MWLDPKRQPQWIPAFAGMTEVAVEKRPCVYMLASRRAGTLYVGVTSDLMRRIYQHRNGTTKGFAHDHGAIRLAWFEMHETMESAILREKRIKKWNRDWKLNLIERYNPQWVDLAVALGFEPLASARVASRRRGNDGVEI